MSLPLIHYPELLGSTIPRLGGLFVVTYGLFKYLEAKRSPVNAIPTVGYSGVLTSYITAFQFLWSGRALIQEGYERYPNQVFKIADISKWLVVISGKKLVNDLRSAPDDVVSFFAAVNEQVQVKYTMMGGPEEGADPALVRTSITRNLSLKFDETVDEISESFKEYIPPTTEWTAIPAFDTMKRIICRTTNRYFVGLPLCRDPGYCLLNEKFTTDVAFSALLISCFPDFLKPLVGPYLTMVRTRVKQGMGYLGSIVEERLAQEEQHGMDWPGKPNDLITWILDTETRQDQRNVGGVTIRLLGFSFGSIYTTTITFTQALFDLAVHPEYVAELREEAEAMIEEYGWTRVSMQKMRKLDSFLKESQRLNCMGPILMDRIVTKDFTLSDGTLLPAGTYVVVASDAMNREEKSFPDALTFKGLRFYDMQGGDEDLDGAKYQMVSIELEQMVFGQGRHACPGRHFAVNEIKAMFVHILLNYDVQLENASLERPKNMSFRGSVIPNMKAKVMFRNRII